MKKIAIWLAAVFVAPAGADVLEKLDNGDLRHGASGWVFPKQLGEFAREGDPVVVNATDSVAQYKDAHDASATVYVYPGTSSAPDASFAGARAAAEEALKDASLAQSWSEGPFRVGSTRALVGDKVFYKIGLGPGAAQSVLYFFDTGPWIIKFRISGPTADKAVFKRTDDFVRDQSWDSLAVTAQNCTGSACLTERPLPIHGAMPEMLAVLLVDQKLDALFPKQPGACDAAAIQAAFSVEPAKQADGTPAPIEAVAACAPAKDLKVSFVRMSLPPDMLTMFERESPDGLSLRGPISFIVLGDRRQTRFTQMRDGRLGSGEIAQLLEGLGSSGSAGADFATGNRNGKAATPVIRFLK
ncbi:MAG TPA: hypothetical protein VKB34_15945 [Povalibacter sp.]|nr:hypothetical protein [Povalibacter sp.]